MNATMLVTVCHLLTGSTPEGRSPEPIPNICTEHVVASSYDNADFDFMKCMMMGPVVIADWKAKSQFANDEFTIQRWRCIPGRAKPGDRT